MLLVFGPQFLDLGTESNEGVSYRAGESPLDDNAPALEDRAEEVFDLDYGGAVEGPSKAGFVNLSASDLTEVSGVDLPSRQASSARFTSAAFLEPGVMVNVATFEPVTGDTRCVAERLKRG